MKTKKISCLYKLHPLIVVSSIFCSTEDLRLHDGQWNSESMWFEAIQRLAGEAFVGHGDSKE